ncbi:MAG: ParB N-terminal domain-containing protein [Gammaproteobacteria bacterium]|nr:ParB N-terminal domain-containing protein [Gammaproteobacteria bacterium]
MVTGKAKGGRLSIQYVDLDELVEWSENPKTHAAELLHQSIARFGFLDPIIVNEAAGGQILAGHGRRERLMERRDAGEPAPKHIVVQANGKWRVPVIRGVSLPSEEASAFAVTANRLGEKGGWDETGLLAVLEELARTPTGLDGVGFTEEDIDSLHVLAAMESDMPDGWKGYDESIAEEVELVECPSCGHRFPK